MTTLAIMKDRIARDIRRSNMATQIGEAINIAIGEYENDRFWFNESRNLTFSTVAMKEFYTEADVPGLANIRKIDSVFLYMGNTPFELVNDRPIRIESASQNGTMSGQPGEFLYYDRTIRLYPIPADVWTIRITGAISKAAPATDTEVGNVWMVEAEWLIRTRAKLDLARNVLFDDDLERRCMTDLADAELNMRVMTTRRTKTRKSRIASMEF
jgi:hypothetical protein